MIGFRLSAGGPAGEYKALPEACYPVMPVLDIERLPDRRKNMDAMMFLIALGTLATVGILFTGLGSMVKGGEFDDQHGHQLMFARVGMQGITLLLVVLAVLLKLH